VHRRAFTGLRAGFGVARVSGSRERGLWEEKQHISVVWCAALRMRGNVGCVRVEVENAACVGRRQGDVWSDVQVVSGI
jgi:hypothetical protein